MKFLGVYDYTVILTYMSLFSAFLGMIMAHKGAFAAAVICLLVSGICDAFDGTVARSKKDRTDDEKAFGIQLDSLCDVVSFGVFPAYFCYSLGIQSAVGIVILGLYCVCAVIRLAFFNVQEGKRQQTEGGANKVYRGLPVTTMSMILPPVYLLRFLLPRKVFTILMHIVPAIVGFLFILDVPIRKPDMKKLFCKH
jgi:CDP-diacylglycerol--serine O-phosphatidyltransferase